MTRKHFNKLAAALAVKIPASTEASELQRKRTAMLIADICYQENPMFDRRSFMIACGFEE